MRKPVVLITGAGGEIGHGLVTRLSAASHSIITLDVSPLDPALASMVTREFTGSITDVSLLERMLAEFEVDHVYHLAALLSTRSEFTPTTAHHVNVEGTLNLLEFSQRQGESHGRTVVFVYPSSIAAYGLRDLPTKARAGRVREDEHTHPTTMYGCNKLYCEQLGSYYARHYKQLSADAIARVDFRAFGDVDRDGLQPAGPAETAGLLLGDVLLEANESRLAGPDELLDALSSVGAGKAMTVKFLRGGSVKTVSITPGDRGREGGE